MTKKKLLYLVLIPLLVLLLATAAALYISGRTIGWSGLVDLFQLPQSLSIDKINLFEIDQLELLDLDGVKQLKIKAVSETITILPAKNQASARLKGSYRASTELSWQAVRKKDQLLLEAVYPRFGLYSSDLDILVQLPDSFRGELEIETVSGQVALLEDFAGSWASLAIDSVSADVDIASFRSEAIEIETVSGEINLRGGAAQISCQTVSGTISLTCLFVESLNLETISADIKLLLAGEADLSLVFSSISGEFSSEDLSASSFTQDKDKLKLQLGDGSGQAQIKTISGDLFVKGYLP